MSHVFTPDPKAIIPAFTFGGDTFKCTQRTAAHLLHTQERLTKLRSHAVMEIVQPCYNTGVALSAGTHDYDAVVDIRIPQLTWEDGQKFVRQCGWAGWWRHTGSWAAPSAWHIHMASLGAPAAGCTVGEFIDGGKSLHGSVTTSSQYADYYNHAQGLAGEHTQNDDPTWHPANIDSTIFSYADWQKHWEETLPLNDADLNKIKAIVKAEVADVLDTPVNSQLGTAGDPEFKDMNLRQLLKSLFSNTKAPAKN